MYEDVCLQCGKPLVDGRAYCSDDCESADATSPSISTASSTFSSPHLSTALSPDTAEIPALLPSALGGSPLHVYSRYRKMNTTSPYRDHPWSAFPDPEDVHEHDLALPDDLHYHDSEKSSSSFLTPVATSGLSYARRPSSTNNHSTVPLLHHRSSSGASSPSGPSVIPRSAPSPVAVPSPSSFTEDDFSDIDKNTTLRARTGASTPSKTKKRNRASLPAYFSLLQLTSTISPPKDSKKSTASRSVPKNSPQTPRTRDRGLSITAPSTSAITPTTVMANQSVVQQTPRGRERGRSRRRGEGSSSRSDSRRDAAFVNLVSPSKSPCQHLSQKSKRIDSLEKVVDWVSSSIGTNKRRLRSPIRTSNGDVGLENHRPTRQSESEERRGRRRAHELDHAPNDARGAPGFGNGRSGIRDRERRGVGLGLTGMSMNVEVEVLEG